MDFCKGLQFFFGALQPRLLVSHIQLHHFLARTRPRVGDSDRDLQRVVRVDLLGTQPKGTITEGRIGEAKAKGKQWRDVLLVVVAIADEEPFPIVDLAV